MAEEGIDLTPSILALALLGAGCEHQRLYQEHPKALRVVDPVMSDGSKWSNLYARAL